jgi:hypothetical protein
VGTDRIKRTAQKRTGTFTKRQPDGMHEASIDSVAEIPLSLQVPIRLRIGVHIEQGITLTLVQAILAELVKQTLDGPCIPGIGNLRTYLLDQLY